MQQENSPMALECFRKALTQDKKDYRLWLAMGDYYSFRKDYNQASIHYQHCLELFPSCINAYCRLIRALDNLGKHSLVQQVLTKALSIDKENPEV